MSRTAAQRRRNSQSARRAIPRAEQREVRSLNSTGFSIAPEAILGNLAPGPEGGTLVFDFEIGGLNSKGQGTERLRTVPARPTGGPSHERRPP